MHGVAADVVLGVLHRCRLGEEPYGALGRRVRRGAIRIPHQPRRRGDVDDGATAGTPHGWNGVLCAQKDPLDIDRHNAVPVIFGGLLDAFADENAGVVHQHIYLAVAALCRVYRGAPVCLAGDVQVDVGHLATGGPDLRLDLFPFFVPDISQDYLGALTDEQLRLGGALSPCTTADQCDFAIEPAHNAPLSQTVTSTSNVSLAVAGHCTRPPGACRRPLVARRGINSWTGSCHASTA